MNDISPAFITHATEILAETNLGMSGPEIVRTISAYAVEYDVNIPHASYPFDAPNKRTALFENIMAFPDPQRYLIIRELCDHRTVQEKNKEEARRLKIQLVTRYGHLDPGRDGSKINETLIEQTRHWLDQFPEVLDLYNEALQKHEHGVFTRNVLDDLRLSLEKLLHSIFQNHKSLENQIQFLGPFIKHRGGSAELSNMFLKLVDYYTKYQNTYIKHDAAVIEEEVEFVFEITSSFMKHFVRLNEKSKG